MSFFSRRHYQRVSPRADTAAEQEARVRRNEIWAQVARETEARYPVIAGENFTEAERWRQNRFRELTPDDPHAIVIL